MDLLYNMLIVPYEKRYNIEQVMNHAWFDNDSIISVKESMGSYLYGVNVFDYFN